MRACIRCRLQLRAPGHASLQQDKDPRKFQSRSYPSPEVICLVERRILLFWTMRGQTRIPTSLPSLHGPGSVNPRWLTIGCGGWLLNSTARHSLSSAGLSTDREAAGTLRPPMNSLTRLSLGLEIQIHGSEPGGRRAKG